MLENYIRVRLKTNKYQLEGASAGDLGYIIEVYPDGGYEVEFSDENGTTFAQIVAREDELQPDEPSLLADGLAMSGSAMETVYITPPSVQQQSKLTRSNKK
jgi:hypothetical protein